MRWVSSRLCNPDCSTEYSKIIAGGRGSLASASAYRSITVAPSDGSGGKGVCALHGPRACTSARRAGLRPPEEDNASPGECAANRGDRGVDAGRILPTALSLRRLTAAFSADERCRQFDEISGVHGSLHE